MSIRLEARYRRIAQLTAEGLDPESIAERMQCDRWTIYNALGKPFVAQEIERLLDAAESRLIRYLAAAQLFRESSDLLRDLDQIERRTSAARAMMRRKREQREPAARPSKRRSRQATPSADTPADPPAGGH